VKHTTGPQEAEFEYLPVQAGWTMPESGAATFTDPDGYKAGFSGAQVDLTVTSGADFNARVTWLRLHKLEIYRSCESLARIASIELTPSRAFISFPIGATSLIADGLALKRGDIVFHGCGERTHQCTFGACEWGLISLRPEQLAACARALTGLAIAAPRAGKVLRPARRAAALLLRLYAQACRLVETRRELIENPEVARALEQELLRALINCLMAKEIEDDTDRRRRHAAVVVRFEDALTKRNTRKFALPALCAEIEIPERTLRMCCSEVLGVSPTRYHLLRRLNMVRSELRRASPSAASVAEIARSYHFMEPGRFATIYRATFGELPSTTLQRGTRALS
jgi:AraC-like DNA-binding protein